MKLQFNWQNVYSLESFLMVTELTLLGTKIVMKTKIFVFMNFKSTAEQYLFGSIFTIKLKVFNLFYYNLELKTFYKPFMVVLKGSFTKTRQT